MYATEPVFRAALDRAAQITSDILRTDVRAELVSESAGLRLAFPQTGGLIVQHALHALLEHWQVTPTVVVGQGTGEYAAASAAGAIAWADALRIARARIGEGRGEIALVGGGFAASRWDMLILYARSGLWQGGFRPLSEREGGGMVLGSMAAYLVLEAAEHARARGARALARLDAEQREAFLLKHVEGLSYEEMAELTGAGVSALKMRVKRACDRLRGLLQEAYRA